MSCALSLPVGSDNHRGFDVDISESSGWLIFIQILSRSTQSRHPRETACSRREHPVGRTERILLTALCIQDEQFVEIGTDVLQLGMTLSLHSYMAFANMNLSLNFLLLRSIYIICLCSEPLTLGV
jgi:hypothetical protein